MLGIKQKIRKTAVNFFKHFNITAYVYYTFKYNDPFLIKKELFGNKAITIFDVGAHDGRTIKLYRKHFPNSTMFSFEPTPETFENLKNNASNYQNAEVFNVALSNFVGQTEFFVNKSSLTNSILKPFDEKYIAPNIFHTVEKIVVNTNTIDAFCKEKKLEKINILKIDVQGAELDVLKGAAAMLTNKNIDLIYLEVEFVELYLNQPLFHDISSFLKTFDYNLYYIYNISVGKDGQMIYGDAIFLPNRN